MKCISQWVSAFPGACRRLSVSASDPMFLQLDISVLQHQRKAPEPHCAITVTGVTGVCTSTKRHMVSSTCWAHAEHSNPIRFPSWSQPWVKPSPGHGATGRQGDSFDSTDSMASTHLGLDGSYSDESGPEISATFEARPLPEAASTSTFRGWGYRICHESTPDPSSESSGLVVLNLSLGPNLWTIWQSASPALSRISMLRCYPKGWLWPNPSDASGRYCADLKHWSSPMALLSIDVYVNVYGLFMSFPKWNLIRQVWCIACIKPLPRGEYSLVSSAIRGWPRTTGRRVVLWLSSSLLHFSCTPSLSTRSTMTVCDCFV